MQSNLSIELDEDLRRYLNFLVGIKHIGSGEEAALAALRIFKKLNMHTWLPYVYQNGSERLLIVGHGLFNDVLSTMQSSKLYAVARATALNRKVFYSVDPELDLSRVDNWGVVLNELENYGWGKFTRDGEEVKVEYLGVPVIFLKGFLESLFGVVFQVHQVRSGEMIVLRPS